MLSLATVPENSALRRCQPQPPANRERLAGVQGTARSPLVAARGGDIFGTEARHLPAPRLSPFPINRPGRPVVQRLVQPLLVVEREVVPQPTLQFRHPLVAVQVDVFILHAPPETLHDDVVQAS